MHIDIFAKNIELDNPLRVFVEEKIGGLEKYFKNKPVEAMVEIGKPSEHHKKGPFFYAEANLKIEGQVLRAEAKHMDLRAAITDVKDELKIQISKLKERSKDLNRKPRKI